MAKIRLDLLVQRIAGISRSKAQGLITAGQVRSPDGEPLNKAGLSIDETAPLTIVEGPKYVSRGGEKLEAALDAFRIDVSGRIAIDAGASTGGFTDCMLQRGVERVYAVDVGYGQLAWEVRQDPRVIVMERTNARSLRPEDFDEQPSFFTVDCSFISLRLVTPPLFAAVAGKAEGVALIKPQFEAGREQVGKGGVVHDDGVRNEVVESLKTFWREVGVETVGVIRSPLRGPAGNVEFLAYLRRQGE